MQAEDLPTFASEKNRFLKINRLKRQGVVFIDERRVYIEDNVEIGEGTVVYPDVYIYGKTTIGENCTIEQGAKITDSKIKKNCTIGPNAVIEDSTLAHSVSAGFNAHIYRSVINPLAEIAHAQIVRSFIGKRTKVKHSAYVGDAKVLRDCNIGAGAVFCNYDGSKKHETIVHPDVFIGSGTMIIAPCTIERTSYIAAGSVISKKIPPRSLVIARGQKHRHYTLSATLVNSNEGMVIKEEYITKDEEGWHIQKPA